MALFDYGETHLTLQFMAYQVTLKNVLPLAGALGVWRTGQLGQGLIFSRAELWRREIRILSR